MQDSLFPGGVEPQPLPPVETLPPMAQLLVKFHAWVLSGACKIRDRKGRIVPLVPNVAQMDTHKAMLAQALQGKPIRLIRLKARKVGVSTWVQALYYYLTRDLPNMTAVTVAHSRDSNAEIFEITKRIHHFDPDAIDEERSNRRELAYDLPHGSVFRTESASGTYIGSGSTIFFLHMSELAKWEADVIADQLLSLKNAVPTEANTIVVIESTANRKDPTREFETHWKKAEAGESDYLPIFTPWFAEPEYRRKSEPLTDLSDYERNLMTRFSLDFDQIAWRREMVRNNCNGSELLFKQEFPATPDEAFQVATGLIFPMLSRATHERRIDPIELRRDFDLYRGIDWGGAHPFVCLWVAHRPGPSAFSIDVMECMQSWEQLVGWSRGANGRPHPLNDDACDALRYVITTFKLNGHVHVYRELFVPNSAQLGMSEVDLALRINKLSETEIYVSGVADRSRPNSIVLFNQHGVPCVAAERPRTTVQGEIEDGLAVMQALMMGTADLKPFERSETYAERAVREYGEREFDYGLTEELAMLERQGRRESDGMTGSGLHPMLGELY